MGRAGFSTCARRPTGRTATQIVAVSHLFAGFETGFGGPEKNRHLVPPPCQEFGRARGFEFSGPGVCFFAALALVFERWVAGGLNFMGLGFIFFGPLGSRVLQFSGPEAPGI